jgi:hypothetical protein
MRDKDGGTPRLVLFDFGEACKISDDCQECAGTVAKNRRNRNFEYFNI